MNLIGKFSGAAAFALMAAPVWAQTMDIVVPFSAGGGTDTVARVFAPAFGESIGMTTVIRNLAGASGTIGAGEVAKARPDGTQLGYLPIGTVIIQPLLTETSYSAEDLKPICQTTSTPMFLMVSQSAPWNTVEEVVAAAKDKRLIYGSSGPGTILHLAMAAFSKDAEINTLHLPFEGTGPAMNAMAGGEIQLFADTATVLETNGLKPLAIFGSERSADYPDVPTMAEAGYPNLNFAVWQGLFAPTDLPEELTQSYATACETAVNTEGFKNYLESSNTVLAYLGPEEFAAYVQESQENMRQLLNDIGMTR